jgi:hypothetical protein
VGVQRIIVHVPGQSSGACILRILWVQYVKSRRRQNSDSYDAIEPRISGGFTPFSHAARAEVGLDFIRAKF